MKKLVKVILAILGGANFVFGLVTPLFIALLIVTFVGLNPINQTILLVIAALATLFRALVPMIPTESNVEPEETSEEPEKLKKA